MENLVVRLKSEDYYEGKLNVKIDERDDDAKYEFTREHNIPINRYLFRDYLKQEIAILDTRITEKIEQMYRDTKEGDDPDDEYKPF